MNNIQFPLNSVDVEEPVAYSICGSHFEHSVCCTQPGPVFWRRDFVRRKAQLSKSSSQTLMQCTDEIIVEVTISIIPWGTHDCHPVVIADGKHNDSMIDKPKKYRNGPSMTSCFASFMNYRYTVNPS